MNIGKPTSLSFHRKFIKLSSSSGFELALQILPYSKNNTYIDIGAGGFLGETTTKFIEKRRDAKLILIERNVSSASELSQVFPQATIFCASYDTKFDVLGQARFISIDLDLQLIEQEWTDFLPAVSSQLERHTYLLVSIIHNLDAAFSSESGYIQNRDSKTIYDKSFQIFGTTNVKMQDLKKYCKTYGYKAIAIFDKQLGTGPGYGVGWALVANSNLCVARFKIELFKKRCKELFEAIKSDYPK